MSFDLIVLSPHLDDAVLSCGGTIAQRAAAGQRILVVTVMAGDPPLGEVSAYAGSLESRWELLQEAAAVRRSEDIAACRVLGASWQHWPIPDCIYRRHPRTGRPFYTSDDDIFGDVHPADGALVNDLLNQMQALPPADDFYVPLGIGHHVDHQLTRAAAERLNRPLIYYEDYPYAQNPEAVQSFWAGEGNRWQARTVNIDPPFLAMKIEAIACYRSQLSTFFINRRDLEEQLSMFSTRVGGERVWNP